MVHECPLGEYLALRSLSHVQYSGKFTVELVINDLFLSLSRLGCRTISDNYHDVRAKAKDSMSSMRRKWSGMRPWDAA